MQKIGDAAKQFNISNRTLRYWEEAGILESSRMENGYRFYDDENSARIRQIVLLRKLKMPIADIERVFMKADFDTALAALTTHLQNLRQDAAEYNVLIGVTERLIQQISGCLSMDQIFSCLETQNDAVNLKQMETSKNDLSERGFIMGTEMLNNVRIVRIPALTVASYRAESTMPEDDCARVTNKFVLENNLHKWSGYRYFGFNNPGPSEGRAVYGYELWVSIPENFEVPPPMARKQFGGGLYASISTQLNEIGERWRLLFEWCKNSDLYDVDDSLTCLEECTMGLELFISEKDKRFVKQLDLLEPVKLR